MKHIVVFGANGRVGSLVVDRLLASGHRVTAFVHEANGLRNTKSLNVVEGDIHDASAVSLALEGAGSVISTLGSWGTPTKDILQSGMTNIIPAMQQHGIKRIISLTGSEARAAGDKLSIIHRLAHFAATVAAGKILVDGEVHIKQLGSSGLEWTVIRSPVMNSKGNHAYSLSSRRPFPWVTINRQAVVDAIVAELENDQNIKRAPFIERA